MNDNGARKGTSVWRQALWSKRSMTTGGHSAGCGTIRMMKLLCNGKEECERFFRRDMGLYSDLDGEMIIRAIQERVNKEMGH